MLPEDIILNTRRAFSTSNTTLNGYSASLGAPEGRYIAPANSADCIQVKAGDCAPRNLLLLSPWFKRVDFGVAKRLETGGSTNVEVRFDLLNLFDSPNFNPVANPGSRRDDLPHDRRLSRSEQYLRSGRPNRPADVPVQLVSRYSQLAAGSSTSGELPVQLANSISEQPASGEAGDSLTAN